jgi:hypothetical protein
VTATTTSAVAAASSRSSAAAVKTSSLVGQGFIGGSGSDALTGGEGADAFQCEGPGEVLDPQPHVLLPAICIASAPPVEPAPAPAPPVEAPSPAPAPAPGVAGLPVGFLGFGKPVVRATREGLRVTLTNVHSAPVELKLATSERFRTARGTRTARYRLVQKTIPAGARATLRLRASRALRRQVAAQLSRVGRVVRRPSLTVTNVATGGKRSVRPRLTLTRR